MHAASLPYRRLAAHITSGHSGEDDRSGPRCSASRAQVTLNLPLTYAIARWPHGGGRLINIDKQICAQTALRSVNESVIDCNARWVVFVAMAATHIDHIAAGYICWHAPPYRIPRHDPPLFRYSVHMRGPRGCTECFRKEGIQWRRVKW